VDLVDDRDPADGPSRRDHHPPASMRLRIKTRRLFAPYCEVWSRPKRSSSYSRIAGANERINIV
jgi:hypothetical protein